MVRDELVADAKEFGDDRRSPIIEREAAKAIDVTQLLPTEPITVILSERVGCAPPRGHEVDARTLDYKTGDGFRQTVRAANTSWRCSLTPLAGRTRCRRTAAVGARSRRTALDQPQSAAGRHLGRRDDGQSRKICIYWRPTPVTASSLSSNMIANKKAGKTVLKATKGAKVLCPQP